MAFAYFFYFGGFLLSLINPFWGLVTLIVSVLIRFQDRFPEITAIKPFSLLFLGMILSCIIHKDKLAKQVWKQDNLLLGMLGVSMVGLLLLEPGDIISETWEYISSLAFYYFASRIIQQPRQFMILFAVMSSCIVYMGYEAIVDVALNPETSIFIDVRNGRWQGLGYYANANEFGQLMITTIPFLLAALLMKNNLLIKLGAIAYLAILIFVVGKTGSRTVMVLLGLMVVLNFVLRGGGNIIKKSIVGGIFGAVLLVGLSFAPGPIQDRLGTILDAGSDSSFQGRTRAWGHGFDMLSWYPVTGVGKGQWMEYHGLMPHNSYVQIMAELGPIGIFLFIWILRLSFREFLPYFKEDHPPPDGMSEGAETERKIVHPIWGETTEKVPPKEKAKPISKELKSVVIAVAIVFVAWLIYIFLGNQGYAIWTYFYIGLCAAVRNLIGSDDESSNSQAVFAK